MKLSIAAVVFTLATGTVMAGQESLEISVSTDRQRYARDDSLWVALTASNATGEATVVDFSCPCCIYRISIEDLSGREVAYMDPVCPQVAVEEQWGPRETMLMTHQRWRQTEGELPGDPATDPLAPPGSYRAKVRWEGKGVFYSPPFEICDGFCNNVAGIYLPAAGNNVGLNGTRWRTDLDVQGRGGGDIAITVSLLEHGIDNSHPETAEFDIPGGTGTVNIDNVLEELFGFAGSAALHLEVRGGSVAVHSRTYNDDPAGTYGQFVAGVPTADVGSNLLLTGLAHGNDRRTNVGVINTTDEPIAAWLILMSDDPSADPPPLVRLELAPYEYRQLVDVYAHYYDGPVNRGMIQAFAIESAIIAYASVIDNRSGDAVFVPGFPASTALSE